MSSSSSSSSKRTRTRTGTGNKRRKRQDSRRVRKKARSRDSESNELASEGSTAGHASVGVTGDALGPLATKYYKNIKLDGLIRVTNLTNRKIVLQPSARQLKKMGLDPSGADDKPNHLPLFWDEDVAIRVIKVNQDILEGERELSPDDMLRIKSRDDFRMNELVSMVPPIPGSESKQHTMSNYLGYRRSCWYAMRSRLAPQTSGPTVNIMTGEFSEDSKDEACYIVRKLLHGSSLCFTGIAEEGKRLGGDGSAAPSLAPELDEFLTKIGNSGMVSLMQKIVRRRPSALRHPDHCETTFRSENVLRAIVWKMCDENQPGLFLPQQGVFITARQHLLKRAMTCMAEDSEYNLRALTLLGAAAVLSAEVPEWQPSPALVARWATILVDMWASDKTSSYNAGNKIREPTMITAEALPTMFYYHLGGMDGDKGMLRYLFAYPQMRNKFSGTSDHIDSLDIFVDQHTEARYIWLLNNVQQKPDYSKMLVDNFHRHTGANPRRPGHTILTEESELASCRDREIFQAQKDVSQMLRGIMIQFPSEQERSTRSYHYQLSDGWLASEIGVYRDYSKVFVTVPPNDLNSLVAIPQPSRNAKWSDLSSKDRDAAIQKARAAHREGRKYRYVEASDGETKQPGEWQVRNEGSWIPWSQFRSKEAIVFETPQNAKMPSAPKPAILLACAYLAGHDPVIQLPRMNRNGIGTKIALTGWEGHAYRYLRKLAELRPHALWPSGQFAFKTRCIALRHELRARIMNHNAVNAPWPFDNPSDDRQLLPLQVDALAEMMQAHKQRMGVFLWMLVGSGKTLTVLRYLEQTHATSVSTGHANAADRIVWMLPMSAMRSVAAEIQRFGWKCKVLVPSTAVGKSLSSSSLVWTTNRNLEPGCVTLVEHDHVRRFYEDLAPQMVKTALVYDEVHKAMAASTQRTTYALKLAQIAAQMVCLTGTPIVKSNAYTLMNWLKMCVPFQVKKQNFWVAANAMVAHLATTRCKVEHTEESINLTPEQRSCIYKHMPGRLGGSAGNRPDWGQAWAESRAVVDTWLVEKTLQLVYGARSNKPQGLHLDRDTFPSEHAYAVAVTRQHYLTPADTLLHLPQRVMLVSESRAHAATLIKALLKAGAKPGDVITVGGRSPPEHGRSEVLHEQSPCLDADEAKKRSMPRICVVPVQYCEGYTLTWMTVMLTGVYPSNQAKRTQLEGRINRACCQRLHRHYFTAMAGLTQHLYKYHRDAKNLETALKLLSKAKNT